MIHWSGVPISLCTGPRRTAVITTNATKGTGKREPIPEVVYRSQETLETSHEGQGASLFKQKGVGLQDVRM